MGRTHEEIVQDWKWVQDNLQATLTAFEREDDITDFVTCKIQSLLATHDPLLDGKSGIIMCPLILNLKNCSG